MLNYICKIFAYSSQFGGDKRGSIPSGRRRGQKVARVWSASSAGSRRRPHRLQVLFYRRLRRHLKRAGRQAFWHSDQGHSCPLIRVLISVHG